MAIRQAILNDVPSMVDLSEAVRSRYETYQPRFWRKAQDSRGKQTSYFESQLQNERMAMLVHETSGTVDGFVIANLGRGQECSIDDFALANEQQWESIGKALLLAAGAEAKKRGIQRYVVVCGHLDVPKRQMLNNFGLEIVDYWYTALVQSGCDLPEGIHIRNAVASDAPSMQGIAKTSGREFAEIGRDNFVVLVCEQGNAVIGYAIAAILTAPPVYDAGGPVCLVIESAMNQHADWRMAGKAMLQVMQNRASQQGAVQYVVVCEASHHAKRDTLHELGSTIASEWYGGDIQ